MNGPEPYKMGAGADAVGAQYPAPQPLSIKLKAQLKTHLTEDIFFFSWLQEQAGLEQRINGKCQRFKCGTGPQLQKYGD